MNRPFRRDSFLACTVVLLTTCFCVVFAVKAADAVEFTPRSIGGGVASGPFYRGLIGSAGFAVQWHNFDVSASTVIFRDLSVDGGATSSLYRFGMAIVGRGEHIRTMVGGVVDGGRLKLFPTFVAARIDVGALSGDGTAAFCHLNAGSPWSRATDLFGIGVVTRRYASMINEIGVQIGLSTMISPRLFRAIFASVPMPFVELHAGFSGDKVQLLPQFRLGFSKGIEFATVGLAVRFGGHEVFNSHAGRRNPPPPTVRAAVAPPSWPDTQQVLRRGRRFFLLHGPLRVAFGSPVPASMDVTCVVDESAEADDASWYHVQCDGTPAAGAAPAWVSGCYRVDRLGIWKLPFCPGDAPNSEDGPSRTASLFIPSVAPGQPPKGDAQRTLKAHAAALDLTNRQVLTTTVRVAGVEFPVTCVQEQALGRHVHCYDLKVGLLWAARQWDEHIDSTPERGMLVIYSDNVDLPAAAPTHLAFHDASSAQCETSPACRAFGQCHAGEAGCVALNDSDCRSANVCRSAGLCRALGGGCDVGSDEDCAASEACRLHKQCARGAGRCEEKR